MSQQPKLSIIVSSRNDNHGGEMLKRMTIFMKGLLYQTKKFQLPVEVVFVEWNPPEGAPLLNEVLPKPQAGDYLTVRYIIVPNSVHLRYKRGAEIPLFQMIAKNVGIRRAKSDFILCSNVDLLFSDHLMQILKNNAFEKRSYYRANRADVPNKLEAEWSTDKALTFCRDHVMQYFGKDSRFKYIMGWPAALPKNNFTMLVLDQINRMKLSLSNDPVERVLNPLDTNACGDFTMLHRDGWNDIRGYLELDLYSLHIDTFAVMMAAIMDYKQVIFPRAACTFHVEHDSGWESMNPIEKIKFWERRPGLSLDFIWEAAKYMLTQNKKISHINDENWGMPNEEFREIVLSPS